MLSWSTLLHRPSSCYRRSSQGELLMTVSRYRLCVLMLLVLGIGIGSPAILAQGQGNSLQSAIVPDQSANTIGPGDLLDLTVFNVPELILKVRVDSHGVVSLPLIGDMKLAGTTVRDAQLLIARELVDRQMVKKPQVSVFIEEFATQGITVYGEVNTPGIYPLMGPHKLYDAISAAGGLTLKSGRTLTILHAGQTDHPEAINLLGSLEQTNVTISPGDTIIVPKTGVVYVLGEVNKPGVFLMENNTSISLVKAIALAQGTTKLASLKRAIILRKSPDGTAETTVSLDRIYSGKDRDLQLSAEDTVFVPLSNVKNYGAMGIQAAIQAALYSLYAVELH